MANKTHQVKAVIHLEVETPNNLKKSDLQDRIHDLAWDKVYQLYRVNPTDDIEIVFDCDQKDGCVCNRTELIL
jgi:hypothetical protein